MTGPFTERKLPDSWRERLRAYLKERTGEDREELSAYDFKSNSHVLLRFPDGSFALFRHAFCVVAAEDDEAAVFTEHCGHHIFPAHGLHIEALESAGVE